MRRAFLIALTVALTSSPSSGGPRLSTQFTFLPYQPKSYLNSHHVPGIKDLTQLDVISVMFEAAPEVFLVITAEDSGPEAPNELTIVRRGRTGLRAIYQSREPLPSLERFFFFRDAAGFIVVLARTSTAEWIPIFVASDSRAHMGDALRIAVSDCRCLESEGDSFNPVVPHLSLQREANTVLLTFDNQEPTLHNAFPCEPNLGDAYKKVEFLFVDGDLRDSRTE